MLNSVFVSCIYAHGIYQDHIKSIHPKTEIMKSQQFSIAFRVKIIRYFESSVRKQVINRARSKKATHEPDAVTRCCNYPNRILLYHITPKMLRNVMNGPIARMKLGS